jgi:ATP-dependent DNA helicase DinG
MITEAQAHQALLEFLRSQDRPLWQHHLTLTRLVVRAFRLGRSALIQTATRPATYRLSYLAAALLWPDAVVLVTPEFHHESLLTVDIPRLLAAFGVTKTVQTGEEMPPEFQGLWVTTPETWLCDRLSARGGFPPQIPTLIDPADDWAQLTRQHLTLTLTPQDWDTLWRSWPAHPDQPDPQQIILNLYQSITQAIRRRPSNPYHSHPLNPEEIDQLTTLHGQLPPAPLPSPWEQFRQQWPQPGQLHWASRNPATQHVNLHLAPIEVDQPLRGIWEQQPIVLMGGFLGLETNKGHRYRQQLGLGDWMQVKFSPQRQNDYIQLYIPDRMPLPNTRDFQPRLLDQVLRLCRGGMISQRRGHRQPPDWIAPLKRPVVVIVDDVPLRGQVAATVAAEFGSGVKVEQMGLAPEGILVCGWTFWRCHQEALPLPQLLIIATLPLPSMENPLVAGRVRHYKHQHQDWFHYYLLPVAMQELQRAIVPVREVQGVVALLDNRVNHRSYGAKILTALEPMARVNTIDFV